MVLLFSLRPQNIARLSYEGVCLCFLNKIFTVERLLNRMLSVLFPTLTLDVYHIHPPRTELTLYRTDFLTSRSGIMELLNVGGPWTL